MLARAAAWLERHASDELLHVRVGADSGGRPTLFAGLHPSAEDLEVTALGERDCLVTAKTSTTGPGYHAYLCERVQELGNACGVLWSPPTDEYFDETGYFHTGDAPKLEDEFLAWLRGLAEVLLERSREGSGSFAVSMPTDVRFDEYAFLTTPLGPRSAEWIRDVAQDPKRGLDLFPWWEIGKGAKYSLGRALTHMWIDVPWRAPVDDAERQLLDRVDALLERARAIEPRLAMPSREWAELRGHLGKERASGSESAPATAIGYRRRDVLNALTGGWSLRAPGAFVGRIDEDGTWSAFDGRRTLWFSSFSVKGKDGRPKPAVDVLPDRPPDGEAVDLPGHDARPHRAFVSSHDDHDGAGPYSLLRAEVAADGTLGVLSVAFRDAGDLALAVRIADTLAPGADKGI